MSSAVKDTSSNSPLNKRVALGAGIFLIIEAVITYFVVLNPLFIKVVYQNSYLNENGITYIVKFFGKTFASEAEKASAQVILSLSDNVINMVLIYLIITVIPLFFALFFSKGYAFAKTYMTVVFGAKTVIGMLPLLVPYPNLRNSMRIFGAVDAAICLCACAFFVYLNSVEYAEDMLLDEEQINGMKKRAKSGGLMFVIMAALIIFEKYAMGGYGINWSIFLGWSDQQITQGFVLIVLLAVALVAAILYVKDADWAMCFFAGFGAATALTNLYAIIYKVIWANTTYKTQKALALQGDATASAWLEQNAMGAGWWRRTIFIGLCMVAGGALAVLAFSKIKGKLLVKPTADEKKSSVLVLVSVGALILCFVFTLVGIILWDKKLYSEFVMGAMDYMYLIAYGGLTLFLALTTLTGYSFSKFGMLALYIVVGAANFSSIFTVLTRRSSVVAANPGYKGYDYIISSVMFILSLVCCLSIIVLFVSKEVNNYLYKKRNS